VYCDPTRARFWGQLWHRDGRAFTRLLTPDLIAQAARQALLCRGRGPLHVVNLVWLALAAARYLARSFADLLTAPLKGLRDLGGRAEPPPAAAGRRPHDPRAAGAPTEEAFCQARQAVPWAFWLALSELLAQRFARRQAPRLRWRGRFRLLCLDGTTLAVPNWPALAAAFGTAGNGGGRRQAQARLVMLQLTAARMPCRWDLGPLAECAQAVAARLLTALQPDDLVLRDRGF
jgi:hypothetical protein